jgi:membrane-associated protease RseP (regulator of RpoE activity)
VHECGHFFAARLQNIYVTKFAIGFGPTLLSFTVRNATRRLHPSMRRPA